MNIIEILFNSIINTLYETKNFLNLLR